MGAEVAVGALVAGQLAQGVQGMQSARRGGAVAKAQEKMAAVQRDQTLYDLSLQKRDIRSEGRRFMGRLRNFVATSGAAGTASGQILRQSARARIAEEIHRVNVTEDRVRRQATTEISSAQVARKGFKQQEQFAVINSLLGAGGAVLGGLAGGPASTESVINNSGTADVASPSRSLIGTSKPGGIGGF